MRESARAGIVLARERWVNGFPHRRSAEVIALAQWAAELSEPFRCLRILDAFGHDRHSQRRAEADDGLPGEFWKL